MEGPTIVEECHDRENDRKMKLRKATDRMNKRNTRDGLFGTPAGSLATRREALQLLAGGWMLSQVAPIGWASDTRALDPQEASARWSRVRTVTELKGEVRLKDPRAVVQGAIKTAPVESTSTLDYEELARPTSPDDGVVAFLKFHEATVENRLNKQAIKESLRPDCMEVVRLQSQGKLLTNSPNHPLSSKERDLIVGPIASAFVDDILPKSSVKIGEAWDLSDAATTRLFQLDSIEKSTLEVKLIEADSGKGQLELDGVIDAISHGVNTQITLKGKAQVDRKLGMVTWLALAMDETREIGEAEPGFRINARVRLLRTSLETPTSNESLESLQASYSDPEVADLTEFRSEQGAYRFLANSQWLPITDKGTQAVFKMVQANRTIAQCTIVCQPDMEPGNHMTIEGYQRDVQRSLGEFFQEFEEASEKITESKLRMVRTVAIGAAEGVPVRWINICLSDDSGRRVTLGFTMDDSYTERFGGTDLQIAGGFELLPRTNTAKASSAQTEVR